MPFVVARSLKMLTIDSHSHGSDSSLSYIIVTFSDGRALTLSLDHMQAGKILESGGFDDSLAFIARKEADGHSSDSSLGDYQILSIGTTEPSLRHLNMSAQ